MHLVWVGLFPQLAGGAVLAVGVWTLVEKSDYISLLSSGFYSASAYILIAAGAIVIVTGIIGCCATLREKKSLLIVVKWISYTCDRFPYWASLIASGETPLNSCLYPQLALSVNPGWSSVAGLPSGRLVMSEKLQDVFGSSDLDLVHAGGMNGITSCWACRVCVRHPDAVSAHDTSKTGWFAWRCGYFCTFVNNNIIPLLHVVCSCISLLCFIGVSILFCCWFSSYFPSTVFVLVALYFPAGDHCRGAGLHYLPGGDRLLFLWTRLGLFQSCDQGVITSLCSQTQFFHSKVCFSFSILHQFYLNCLSFSKMLFWYPLCLLPSAFLSFILFSHSSLISLSPLFLTPVFPFLLPGNSLN